MILFFTVLGFSVFAYLLGSLSSAIIVCHVSGLPDPRTEGSGNPGATNMLRVGGKKLAAVVLLGDFLKGFVAVFMASFFMPPEFLGWIGLAAVLGHFFPLFFQFKGGKGVATGAGVFLALSWQAGLLVILIWLLIAFLFRYSSLAAVIATAASPFLAVWLAPWNFSAVLVISLLILWRHRDNMQRLISRQERKMGN